MQGRNEKSKKAGWRKTMKCKNCDYKQKHKPLELVFSGDGYRHYFNGNSQAVCHCGCRNPEPEQAKKHSKKRSKMEKQKEAYEKAIAPALKAYEKARVAALEAYKKAKAVEGK